jgi:hypothetical protein
MGIAKYGARVAVANIVSHIHSFRYFSLPTPRVSFLPPIFLFLSLYKNFGTYSPKFSSSNLEKIRKTHSEVFLQGKKFKKTYSKIFIQGQKKDRGILKKHGLGREIFLPF